MTTPSPATTGATTDYLREVLQAADVDQPAWPEVLRRTVQTLATLPGRSWTGIYLLDGAVLQLGPFVGAPTEHVRIPLGAGICGAAASEAATIVVDDVADDPRYLACFVSTRSEIVVPIFAGGEPPGGVIGEIDIDSDVPAAFDTADRVYLEEVAALLGRLAPAAFRMGVTDAEALRGPAPGDRMREFDR